MKGYLDSKTKTLYIFPQTAAAIPTIAGAEKIAIQQEDLAAWKEANESYADMMFAYNYLSLSVQPKAWSEHENEDLGNDIVLTTGSDTYIEAPATAEAGSTVTITPKTGYSPVTVNIACEEAVVTPGTNNWTFTMPESDVELSATSDDHTITLTGTDASNFTLNKQTALAGETITITPTDAIYYDAYVTLTASTPCGLAWNNDNTNWTCTMPDTDLTLTTSRTSYTLTLTGDASSQVSTSPSSTAPNGSTVSLVSELVYGTGYTATAETEDHDSVTISAEGTFTMPAANVTITVTEVAQGNIEWVNWGEYENPPMPIGYGRYLDLEHLEAQGGTKYGYSSTAEVVAANLEVYYDDATYAAWTEVNDPAAIGFTNSTGVYTNTDNTANTVYAIWNPDTENVDVYVPDTSLTSVSGNVDPIQP